MKITLDPAGLKGFQLFQSGYPRPTVTRANGEARKRGGKEEGGGINELVEEETND